MYHCQSPKCVITVIILYKLYYNNQISCNNIRECIFKYLNYDKTCYERNPKRVNFQCVFGGPCWPRGPQQPLSLLLPQALCSHWTWLDGCWGSCTVSSLYRRRPDGSISSCLNWAFVDKVSLVSSVFVYWSTIVHFYCIYLFLSLTLVSLCLRRAVCTFLNLCTCPDSAVMFTVEISALPPERSCWKSLLGF